MKRIPIRAARLLPLIGSPVDGEALAACRALEKALVAVGCDLHDMAAAIITEPETRACACRAMPGSNFDISRACRDLDGGRLSHRERAFVSRMCSLGNSSPSQAQAAWLADLFAKLSARRAA